jgi:4-amino-4-deoxy-L-arabinose transferase-like glycosyltransferase
MRTERRDQAQYLSSTPENEELCLTPFLDRIEHWLLLGVMAAAVAIRVWSLSEGVPHAPGIDEPAIVDRALRILQTGDWNTHAFDYPTLVIYLHVLVAIARYLLGALDGEWTSLAGMDIGAVYTSGRLVAALIGASTVWLTCRIGRDLESPWLGLLAGAQLALVPMHVRESHFILTDVPVTALTTLTLWLAMRAGRVRTVSAYAWAGAVVGLAAAAKYNGGVALAAVTLVWLLHERSSPDRVRKAGAAVSAMVAAFLIAAPYTVLDLPNFLDGVGAQMARFSARPLAPGDAAWLIYVKHLSLAGWWWLPTAGLGAAIVLIRRSSRSRWIAPLGFGLAYFYILATHPRIFGRYALPLLPVICLLAAVPVVELARLCARIRRLESWYAGPAVLGVGALALTAGFAVQSVGWVGQLKHADTRQMAVSWMTANLPRGTRVAVENSGPRYLARAGFDEIPTGLLVDQPADWYRAQRVEYLVVSSTDLRRYSDLFALGPTVLDIPSSSQRWGPPIRIVKITSPPGSS